MFNSMTATKLSASLAAVWFASSFIMQPALAAPHTDYFNRYSGNDNRPTTSVNVNVPQVQSSPKQVAEQWFRSKDQIVGMHLPSAKDKVALKVDFAQKEERVIAWAQACGRVAALYRDLGRSLRSLPIPATLNSQGGRTSIADMRDMEASWYEDSATFMEDWIRPRKAAATREELDRALDQMDQRSELLAQRLKDFQETEEEIRNGLGVPPPKFDDRLMQYVNRHPDQ